VALNLKSQLVLATVVDFAYQVRPLSKKGIAPWIVHKFAHATPELVAKVCVGKIGFGQRSLGCHPLRTLDVEGIFQPTVGIDQTASGEAVDEGFFGGHRILEGSHKSHRGCRVKGQPPG
jgi:hypothetical protein